MSQYDFNPSGYREWFVNSGKFRFGNPNRSEVFTSQTILDVVAVTVLEAQIPYTFYTINDSNNVILVYKITVGVPSGFKLTLTNGNYTPDTMASILTTLLPRTWPADVASVNPLFSAVTYDSSTSKFTVTFNSTLLTGGGWSWYLNQDINDAFVQAALANNYLPPVGLCIEPLGGTDIRAPSDFSFTPGTPKTLPYSIALGGPPFIAIRGNFGIGGSDNIVLCDNNEDQQYVGNVIGMIPVNTVPGGTITWKNVAPRGGFFSLTAAQISSATFWCTTGDDDSVLDFNGHGFQFKLGFILRNRGNIMSGSRYTGDRGVTSSG